MAEESSPQLDRAAFEAEESAVSFLNNDTDEAHERRIVRCRTCHARIIWFKTEAGKNMPVDADTVEADDEELDLTRHVSHFATCKDAAQHRRPR
jgi:hypothetical protein